MNGAFIETTAYDLSFRGTSLRTRVTTVEGGLTPARLIATNAAVTWNGSFASRA